MKTLKRILLFGIIAGVTFFTACEDDETETINKKNSKEEIQTNSQKMETAFSEMQESEGMNAIEALGGLVQKDDPFTDQKSLTISPDFITNISEILNPEKVYTEKAGDTHFIFNEHTGTYTWRSENTWRVKMDSPSDAIVIEFPTDTANFSETGNNAVLTVSDYKEEEIMTDTGATWMPVTLSAKLEINSTEYVNVNYSLTFDNEGNPTEVDMSLFMKPFTYTLNLTNNSIEFALSKEGVENTLISANLDLTFVNSEMEDVEEINGNFQMGNVNFDGVIRPYALSDSSQYEGVQNMGDIADQMNKHINIKVYKFDSGAKMANLIFDVNENSEYPIMGSIILAFEYNDGTTEDAGPYFESIITKIENMIGELPEDDL